MSNCPYCNNVGQNKEHVIFAYRGANSEIDLSKKVVQRIKTPWIYLTSLSANFIPNISFFDPTVAAFIVNNITLHVFFYKEPCL